MPAKTNASRSFRGFAISTFALLASLFAFLFAARAQQSPRLVISSPSNGDVFEMGQTISVHITSPSHSEFSHVGVIGERPLGFSDMASSVPASVSIEIPKNISCKRYSLTAVGVTPSRQTVNSEIVLIDVEPPEPPVSLELASPSELIMENVGEGSPIMVFGKFSDGSTLVVTQSSRMAFSSSDTSVATVDANGWIKATGAGRASITVSYTQGKSVTVSIPVTVFPARSN